MLPIPPVVHMGRYGPWSITKEDLVEVWSYRAGISVTALGEAKCSLFFLVLAVTP